MNLQTFSSRIYAMVTMFLISFSVCAEEAPLDSASASERAETPIYSDVQGVFDATHNKLFVSLFGHSALNIFIKPSVDSTTLSQIEELTPTELDVYILPFSTRYSRAIYAVVMLVFFTGVIYLTLSNSTFYLGRLYKLVTSPKNSAGMKGVGANHSMRAIATAVLVIPSFGFFYTLLTSDEQVDIAEDYPLLYPIFSMIGEAFKYTELINRSFAGDSSVYSPHYNVPSPDFHSSTFVAFKEFGLCIAKKRVSVPKLGISSHTVSQDISETGVYKPSLVYKASFDDCNIEVRTETDYGIVNALSRSDKLEKAAGITSSEFNDVIEATFKAKMDSYLVTALDSADHIANLYFDDYKGEDDAELALTIDAQNWHNQCDMFIEQAKSGQYQNAVTAFHMLPRCFSRDFLQAFSYPQDAGDDFDQDILQGDAYKRSRFVSVCASGEEDYLGRFKIDRLESCVKSLCDFGDQAKGIYPCSIGVASLISALKIDSNLPEGFMFSPVWTHEQITTNVPKTAKNVVGKLQSKFFDDPSTKRGWVIVSVGTPDYIWERDYTSGEQRDAKDDEDIEFFVKIVTLALMRFENEPRYDEVQNHSASDTTKWFGRFRSCLENAGAVHPLYGACGTNYQEFNRLIDSYVGIAVGAYMLSLTSRGVAKMLVSNEGKQGGVSSSTTDKAKHVGGVLKKILYFALGTVGLATAYEFFVDHEAVMNIVDDTLYSEDPYEPMQSVFKVDNMANSALMGLMAAVHADGFIATIFRLIMMGLMAVLTAFKWLPMLIFWFSMVLAVGNLIVIFVTLPLQIVNVVTDTGADVRNKLKKLTTKWLLTLIRFPMLILGFHVSFKLFDALLPAYAWSVDKLAYTFPVSGFVAEVILGIFIYLLYIICLVVLALICIDSVNAGYEMLKSDIMGSDQEVESNATQSAGSVWKRMFN